MPATNGYLDLNKWGFSLRSLSSIFFRRGTTLPICSVLSTLRVLSGRLFPTELFYETLFSLRAFTLFISSSFEMGFPSLLRRAHNSSALSVKKGLSGLCSPFECVLDITNLNSCFYAVGTNVIKAITNDCKRLADKSMDDLKIQFNNYRLSGFDFLFRGFFYSFQELFLRKVSTFFKTLLQFLFSEFFLVIHNRCGMDLKQTLALLRIISSSLKLPLSGIQRSFYQKHF